MASCRREKLLMIAVKYKKSRNKQFSVNLRITLVRGRKKSSDS